MGANAVDQARRKVNACVDVLCLMQKRWTHDVTTPQWAEQERATREYQQSLDAYAAAILTAACERVAMLKVGEPSHDVMLTSAIRAIGSYNPALLQEVPRDA